MISIIGSGRLGSETAFLLAQRGLSDIKLIDIVKGLPQGHALDIMHSAQSAEVLGSNDFQDIKGSDIIINTTGFARKPGMDRTGLINRNSDIVKSVAKKIKTLAPDSMVIQVSNPLDIMTYIMKKTTGFERGSVMGMGGLLDSQRLAFHISRELRAKPRDINPLVMGEHGESMVPVYSNSFFQGKPVSELIPEEKKKEIAEKTRSSGAEVIGLKGATVFAPAIGIARMAEAIVKNKRETIPLSAYLEGEYGIEGICIGVPAVLGKSGIEKILEPELSEEEEKAFRASAEKIRDIISSLSI